MIIHQPQISRHNGHAILSARIELKNTHRLSPAELWYRFPDEYETCMFLRGDAFLVGAIIPAMALGEDIEVHAPLSPRLVSGLMEYQKILAIWLPKQLSMVKIKYANLRAVSPDETHGETASLFSGGVDSSLILKSNLAPLQQIEQFRIRYAIMVHGADVPLNMPDRFNQLFELSRKALAGLNVNLIPCATNVRAFSVGLVKWGFAHGSALISSTLALSGLLGQLYIASSYNYRDLIPWGSSPLLDHWLSTESLEVVHFGASLRRTDRVKAVADWEPAQKYLRVCPTLEAIQAVNCERCDKCLATKAMLDMEGTLKDFQTFKRPFRNRDYFRWAWVCDPNTMLPRFALRQAIIERRWSVVPFAFVAVIGRWIRYWLDRFLPDRLRKILRDRFYPLEKDPFYVKNLPEGKISVGFS